MAKSIFWLVLSIIGMSLNTLCMILGVLKADYVAAIFHSILFLMLVPTFVFSWEEIDEKKKEMK